MADTHIKGARLADEIRDNLAAWTARDYPGSFVVITGVTLSHNLRYATVWVRILGNDPEGVFKKLQKGTRHYQHRLVVTLTRFKLPFISFTLDQRPDEETTLGTLPN
ncbi:MAG TPA: ribosome-binding factor A [Verrucomicrobiae bacterium]|nr:ribosome-binding factor A [Verrucomicrobiae bacterium]